jgi:hypothetical protein
MRELRFRHYLVNAVDDLASHSMISLKVWIEATETEIATLSRETDYVSPQMADAYRRRENLWAEIRHRAGSGFGRTNREQR